MGMGVYDLILCMDWLSALCAILDCHYRRVTIKLPNVESMSFNCEDELEIPCAYIKPREQKNYFGWLASVIAYEDGGANQLNFPAAREFSDVFPDELPGYLHIGKLTSLYGTALISLSPYLIAPAELKELKVQSEDLLHKGFMSPSVSPWGAPILFDRKQDGSLRLCIDYR